MRPARSLLIYFVVVFVGGALLAPWLYWIVQQMAPHSSLASHSFHRYLDRALLGLAVVGLWPLARSCELRTWRAIGFDRLTSHRTNLARGLAIGAVSSVALWAACIAGGGSVLVSGAESPGKVLAGGVAAAVIVSILEETLFRGGLFGILRKSMDWRLAALISSVVYAFVHFLQKADLPGPITWSSGLQLLPLMFRQAVVAPTFAAGFVNLTVVGLALAVAYQRTGALYASMGLHGAWILLLKLSLYLSQARPNAPEMFWGGENFLNGWIALPFLLGALIATWRWLPAKGKIND